MSGAVLALFPDWSGPVVHYILEVGLPTTLRISAFAVLGATVIGILLGTLLTIEFWASKTAIRGYIEVFRGLPILVTVFIVYFGLPSVSRGLEFGALLATSIALILWGSAQVAEATRGAVQSIPREQHEAASPRRPGRCPRGSARSRWRGGRRTRARVRPRAGRSRR